LSAAPDGDFDVEVARLSTVLSSLFGAAGVSTDDARVTVDSLIAAAAASEMESRRLRVV
jgi:hypothetical protein